MSNFMKQLCDAPSGQAEVLQGNIAFAAGCIRGGVHAADGYPGTPSSEVIDIGLSQVQDRIKVGWSVNEAVAAAVGHGHSIAGYDCVVTMKIPGLFQAGDIFTSGALFVQERGALVYYIAGDFTPSSTQHTLDPRFLFKSCFIPVFEPRNHQEMHEAAAMAVEISRTYKTQVVILPNGNLCHSEGLVHMMHPQQRDPVIMPDNLKSFNVLPVMARKNYDTALAERMPALVKMVEKSSLNHWEKGAGKIGIITYGISDMFVREVKTTLGLDIDILSLAFTNPLPLKLIREFHASIQGDVYVIEDGYRYLQEALQQEGLQVIGKEPFSNLTEWNPGLIAEKIGFMNRGKLPSGTPVKRPPIICAGCPYRLFAEEVSLLKKKKKLDVVFGDIGCNALLYFMNAMDTGLAMGASEAERMGYVMSRPEQAKRCISVIGDGTECHSGMAATRNAIFRNTPGVKVILDNAWTAMTGGQPSLTSPANLAGEEINFNMPETIKAHGAKVVEVGAYEKNEIRKALKSALEEASEGVFTTLIINNGVCIRKLPASSQRVMVEPDVCRKCNLCLVCPGIELNEQGIPQVNNLCSGCGGSLPACVQMCPSNALKVVDLKDLDLPARIEFAAPPDIQNNFEPEGLDCPSRLSLGIRGVGGQGNLFFGRVLSQIAFLAGYGEKNIIKGETHGMAQMGGSVISTFSCGEVASPVLLPGSADCLIVMEKSEVMRPGFLEILKPGGTVLMAATKILPRGVTEDQYPGDEQIREYLSGYKVIEVDVLGKSLELGDLSGRSANVVMMGVLSTLPTFNLFPPELWLSALKKVNAKPSIWAANFAAFNAGREFMKSMEA
ncbi:MAG: 2-oxoacid:acceptor oxidoreductase family protein [Anaerolineaceae bacterium]|nr:2-oxoacid:acceptor oxidoreductase family protein [Anaerolineaceae bacterium]